MGNGSGHSEVEGGGAYVHLYIREGGGRRGMSMMCGECRRQMVWKGFVWWSCGGRSDEYILTSKQSIQMEIVVSVANEERETMQTSQKCGLLNKSRNC